MTTGANVRVVHRTKDDIQMTALSHVEDTCGQPTSGIAKHLEQPKTPAEAKAEKRFVRKTDFIVLPLLASMYFLASLVRERENTATSISIMVG